MPSVEGDVDAVRISTLVDFRDGGVMSTPSECFSLVRSADQSVQDYSRATSSPEPARFPAASGQVELDGNTWRLRTATSSIDWVSPPDALQRLISEMFTSTPQDVLSWVHTAAWRMREETWRGRSSADISSRVESQSRGDSDHSMASLDPPLQCSDIPSVCTKPSFHMNFDSTRSAPIISMPMDADLALCMHENSEIVPRFHEEGKRSPGRAANKEGFPTRNSKTTTVSGSTIGTSTHEFFSYMAVLGNSSAMLINPLNLGKYLRVLLSPTSWTCFICTGLFSFSLLSELWVLSLEVAFWKDGLPSWSNALDVSFFVAFSIDILLNLQTGYISKGIMYMRWPVAISHYVRTWFWIDLLATLPYIMCIADGNGTKYWRCLVLFRIFRLKRVGQWMSLIPLFLPRMRSVIPLIKLQIMVLVVAHLLSFLLALLHPDWVKEHPDGPYGCYWKSLWWSLAALTAGSTPPGPHREGQLIWDILVCYARLLLLLTILDWAKANSFIQFSNKISRNRAWGSAKCDGDNEVDALSEDRFFDYLGRRSIKPSLQIQILQALNEVEEAQRDQANINWLTNQNIDPELRQELYGNLWEENIKTLGIMVPLVQWRATFVAELACVVEEVILAPGTVLFSSGDPTVTAYFILKGQLAVTMAQSTSAMVDYREGMWVGEQSLLNPELAHTETLRCRCRVELMAIHASDFRALLMEHGLHQDFEVFLQQTLWMGLCGRCGVLGDHFSRECPLLEQTSSCPCPLPHRRTSRERRSTRIDRTIGLTKFLGEHRLSRLAVELQRYHIANLNDLSTQAFDDFLDDEDTKVPREDKEKLRRAVDKLRKKAVEGATALMHTSNADEHLIFISHYKEEAGTEATLMQRDLEGCIERENYFSTTSLDFPVFVDSENLASLADLQACVLRSYNVVVLLTPGVLKRPWVLVEIALAFRHEINLIPVEVQRGSFKFSYPDEAYLRGIGTGEMLASDCLQVLQNEEIQLSDLEAALRHLFKLIALPYSPHKSTSIRDAELKDVLKRCSQSKKQRAQLPQVASRRSDSGRTLNPKPDKRTSITKRHRSVGKVNFARSSVSRGRLSVSLEDSLEKAEKDPKSSQISLKGFQLSPAATEAMARVETNRQEVQVFKNGDRVCVTKESRTKGRTGVVTDPDWHNLVKVYMDEDDAKGRIKTFKSTELVFVDVEESKRLKVGQRVRIVKNSRTRGKMATIVDPSWHDLVKVDMDEADEKGRTKSFKSIDLEVVPEILSSQSEKCSGETMKSVDL